MKFNDIKTFTYIGNVVSIDSVEIEIKTALDSNITAVQYHSGRDILEEPLMVSADESKYQYALDEWEEAKAVQEAETLASQPTEAEVFESIFRAERDALLVKVDNSIKIAFDAGLDTAKFSVYRQALRDATIKWVIPQEVL
mgnify:CR=1 FL=1